MQQFDIHWLPGLLLMAGALVGTGAGHAADGIAVLHSFDDADGQYPEGRLVQGSDGAFYGTTYAGGASHLGEIYRVTADGTFTVLHSFTGADGELLDSGLLPAGDGNFYGTTPQASYCGDSGCSNYGGTVFRMAPDGSVVTLHAFMEADAGRQPGPLADGLDGLFYGTTTQGGVPGEGTAYSIAPDGTFSLLDTFGTAGQGGLPHGALARGNAGNFFGTTSAGGTNNQGTVFRMTPAGVVTTLHDFTGGEDGGSPNATLVLSVDGRFFGGTSSGGTDGLGTLFAMTPNGDFTTLYAFHGGDGTGPAGGLVQGTDSVPLGGHVRPQNHDPANSGADSFYGVSGGGYQGYGTLFRLSARGVMMTLHLFTPADGTMPVSAPILGDDGRLYGTTTRYGGAAGAAGSVYAFNLHAALTPVLHLTKTCHNASDTCFTPINTTVGQKVRLDWASAAVNACRASGAWSGSRPIGGSYTFQTTGIGIFTYRLDCDGPYGSITAQTVLSVAR